MYMDVESVNTEVICGQIQALKHLFESEQLPVPHNHLFLEHRQQYS